MDACAGFGSRMYAGVSVGVAVAVPDGATGAVSVDVTAWARVGGMGGGTELIDRDGTAVVTRSGEDVRSSTDILGFGGAIASAIRVSPLRSALR